MGKYLAKQHWHREKLEELGFARRFSNSKGWPGRGRRRLLFTEEKLWDAVQHTPPGEVNMTGPKPWELEDVLKVRNVTLLDQVMEQRNKARVYGTLRKAIHVD